VPSTSNPLRVLYLAGPGDAGASLEAFRSGTLNSSIMHVGYSDQFFRVCRELEIPSLVLTTNSRIDEVEYGNLRVEKIKDDFKGTSGARYQAAHVSFARTVLTKARRFKANVVVVQMAPYPLLLSPLRVLGARLVLAMHCTLWPQFKSPSTTTRFARQTQWPFYRLFDTILSASRLCSDQIRQVTSAPPPIVEFLPLMRGESFERISAPELASEKFRVVFVGRTEADKGVFELVEIASRLRAAGKTNISLDICGDGGALPELRRRVADANLSSVTLHGWCDAEQLHDVFSRSHLSIVPTTSNFVEGFNQVIVESLLAGRPVLTSKVCPAVDYVRSAVVQVPPDDVGAYTDAIVALAADRARYAALQRACAAVSRKFLDPAFGFGSGVRQMLLAFQAKSKPASFEIPFDGEVARGVDAAAANQVPLRPAL